MIQFKGNTGWKSAGKNPAAPSVEPQRRRDRNEWIETIRKLFSLDGIYILDTETTGLQGDVRVIELSIIDLDGNIVFHSLFNPGMPLPEKIPELTGITDEMLETAPFFFQKVTEIVDILSGKQVIAWNAPFDRQWLTNELLMASQGPAAASICWFDAMELSSFASGRFRKWYKLIEAKKDYGIGDSQEHRSTADCFDTLAVLRKIAGVDAQQVSEET